MEKEQNQNTKIETSEVKKNNDSEESSNKENPINEVKDGVKQIEQSSEEKILELEDKLSRTFAEEGLKKKKKKLLSMVDLFWQKRL